MKKLLLTIAILSSVISYINAEQKTQYRPVWFHAGTVESTEDGALKFSYEPKKNGNMVLEKCDATKYDCNAIKRLFRDFNRLPTKKRDMALKARLVADIIFLPDLFNLKR